MTNTGDTRPMCGFNPPRPPDPLADALRDLADAIRGLGVELTRAREDTNYLHIVDGEADDLDARS